MSEQAPKVLSHEDHQALKERIGEVADVAREADRHNEGTYSLKHSAWVDGANGDLSTRLLGQGTASHRLNSKANGQRVDVNIEQGSRDIHSYSDRSGHFANTDTIMRVKRNGERKTLQSENPLVFKMLADIALKNIERKAQADTNDLEGMARTLDDIKELPTSETSNN